MHKKIGVIPQGFRFFDKSTPLEAVRYYSELFDTKVKPEDVVKEVTLDDSKDVLFENLSGGQKQKSASHLRS